MKTYAEIKEYVQRIADINGAAAVLSWDKEVNLPAGGAGARSRQLATLQALSHNELINPSLFTGLQVLLSSDVLTDDERMNLIRLKRDIEQATKFTTEFVKELSIATSTAYHDWLQARKKSNFKLYEPSLARLVDLKLQAAEIRGYTDHPYDALIDEFEEGMTVDILDGIFVEVKEQLVPMLKTFDAKKQADDSFLKNYFNESAQWDFGISVLRRIGYSFNKGRQDKSPHPFTISFSPSDVRVTTRIDEHNFAYMLWSTIHEGGHALYEQGLNQDQYGMPLGQAASLSIHESQSRLWENHVGRSHAFWEYYFPQLKSTFKRQLEAVDLDHFYKAINHIKPNLIRTEADELHYHLHVLIRYQIEKRLISKDLSVSDIPELWNALYKEYLGVVVPDDAAGALPDVHWAFGSFGYFPTYSLGSFYAAQFFKQAEKDISDLADQIRQGQFNKLNTWLQNNIFQHGRRFLSEELCQKITGEPLNISYFIDYVNKKYNDMWA